MATKSVKSATFTPVLTINHFGVEHTIPYAAISELKVGAFQNGTGNPYIGQVLVITNTGNKYYLFHQVEADKETALAVANEFATGIKSTLGWITAIDLTVDNLV